jgi:glycine/D-amino acid oxidase-like deaminating enzyme
MVTAFRPPSFWFAALGEPIEPRAPLRGEEQVDVAIVGAGYSGLWTAYYLIQQEPGCRVAIVESEIAGFGASGRNGGWCSSEFSGISGLMEHPATRDRAIALQRAMFDAVDEVGRASKAALVDCDYAKGGTLTVASNPLQLERLRAETRALLELGFSAADFRWLDADGCSERAQISGALGGVYSPHCAAIQPAKLARGLASFLENRGVEIYEQSPARSLTPREVVTDAGKLLATSVLRCTEAYSCRLPGLERSVLPMHSMMIATEPLTDSLWKEIGLEQRETFADTRRIVTYGQRTADDRLAFGARGLYYYGSRICDYFDPAEPRFEQVHRVLLEFFPALEGVEIAYRWGGALGVTRDWAPFVHWDADSRLGAIGGYAGNGVAATNLAGRTLAELVVGADSERATFPWVNHHSSNWEPEPLRWLGAEAVRRVGDSADRAEGSGTGAALRSRFFDTFASH